MLNAFTEEQLSVLRDLAGLWWDRKIGNLRVYQDLDAVSFNRLRTAYINDIINGLVDPAIWGDDEYRDQS